jgi:NAD(P)-dependent dehydrogenase (short-subunit alcohol dehydrogenase family)
MNGKLEGKVAVVTGGSVGIGLATAKRFAEEGAFVFITGRRQAELDAAVKEIGPNAAAVRADASSMADLTRLFETVRAARGRIDVLYANAGVYEFTPFGTITEQDYDRMFNINVKGVLFTVQQAVPLMINGGSIILTGSIAGSKGFEAGTVYGATKAAIRSFARSWTADLKSKNIRVNVLSPGPVQTPGLDVFANDDVKGLLTSMVPLGVLARRTRSRRPRFSSRPTIPASLPALSCSPMAVQRRSERSSSSWGAAEDSFVLAATPTSSSWLAPSARPRMTRGQCYCPRAL